MKINLNRAYLKVKNDQNILEEKRILRSSNQSLFRKDTPQKGLKSTTFSNILKSPSLLLKISKKFSASLNHSKKFSPTKVCNHEETENPELRTPLAHDSPLISYFKIKLTTLSGSTEK